MKFTLKTAAITLLAAAAFASATPLLAEKHNKGQNIEQRLEKMKKHLNLTDDQSAKIKTILESAKAEAESKKGTYTDKEARHNAKTALKQQTRDKIKAILTPEQQKKAEMWMEKRKH